LILKITLDNDNKVKSLKKYTENNAENIIISNEKTTTINNEGVFLKQMLNNLRKNNLKN
jgi:outer membrane protein assembly factor BamE (lipoprotein component of BamABCDE complex)